MKISKLIIRAGFGTAILAVFLTQAPAFSKTSKVVVVVKADGALADLTLKDIRSIYTGEKLYQGSNKIEPLLNGNDSVASIFFKKILEKTKGQYKKIWNSKGFVDALVAPAVLPDSSDVLRAVYKNDGAIGFVEEGDIAPAQKKYIKVLFTADAAAGK